MSHITVPIKLGLTLAAIAAVALALSALSTADTSAQESDMTYEVTIENLTAGQPFTPPLLVAHTADIDLFEVGDAAITEVQEIAENGNLDPAVTLAGGSDAVLASAVGDAPVLPGESVTLTLDAPADAHLSWVSMLICTNDGFTGLDSVDLPDSGSQSFDTNAYDAGTETNTEDFADIVPPCQGLVGVESDDEGTGATNPDLAEGGVIGAHAGIEGGTDLTVDDHGWTDPVARVTVSTEASDTASPGAVPATGGPPASDSFALGSWAIVLAGIALIGTGGVALATSRRQR